MTASLLRIDHDGFDVDDNTNVVGPTLDGVEGLVDPGDRLTLRVNESTSRALMRGLKFYLIDDALAGFIQDAIGLYGEERFADLIEILSNRTVEELTLRATRRSIEMTLTPKGVEGRKK